MNTTYIHILFLIATTFILSFHGQNKMLALEILDFHPETGVWYIIRIAVEEGNYNFLE